MSVQVEGLTKRFDGQEVVRDISFETGENEILGFLGPNGAGKSTTMKIITCYLPPSRGTVKVKGLDVTLHPSEIKKMTGYLPENNPLYPDMYVHEYLTFIGKLNGLKGQKLKERINEMIQICALTEEQNKLIGSLSKGYRQRVGLAQTLIHDPDVLILDEPTSGLDPNQISEVRNLIKNVSREKTVILSTHIMQEVEALCDKVIIINHGQIVADGSLDDLHKRKSENQKIRISLSEIAPKEIFESISHIEEVIIMNDGKQFIITAEKGKDLRSAISKMILEKGIELLELSIIEDSMEDIFRKLTRTSE